MSYHSSTLLSLSLTAASSATEGQVEMRLQRLRDTSPEKMGLERPQQTRVVSVGGTEYYNISGYLTHTVP